ncbi:MAG: SRPBCC family protein [Woeseiaceae bacterium]|nr:SRPBCC family protein [Woeseiaceae bacterium]
MKLRFETIIEADLDTVWAAFDDANNKVRWQQNLKSFKQVSGDPGRPGAVAEYVYDENGKKLVLTETITERREPVFLAGLYESPVGRTLVVNHFKAVDEHSTSWTAWSNFSFRGVMKIMSLFVAGTIRKRTKADMERFKLLVETDRASASS